MLMMQELSVIVYSRPDIHFVPVKSIEQQDLKALRSVRSRLVEQR